MAAFFSILTHYFSALYKYDVISILVALILNFRSLHGKNLFMNGDMFPLYFQKEANNCYYLLSWPLIQCVKHFKTSTRKKRISAGSTPLPYLLVQKTVTKYFFVLYVYAIVCYLWKTHFLTHLIFDIM